MDDEPDYSVKTSLGYILFTENGKTAKLEVISSTETEINLKLYISEKLAVIKLKVMHNNDKLAIYQKIDGKKLYISSQFNNEVDFQPDHVLNGKPVAITAEDPAFVKNVNGLGKHRVMHFKIAPVIEKKSRVEIDGMCDMVDCAIPRKPIITVQETETRYSATKSLPININKEIKISVDCVIAE